MAVIRAPDLDRARALAGVDPAVAAKLIELQVRPWMMAMSSPEHQR